MNKNKISFYSLLSMALIIFLTVSCKIIPVQRNPTITQFPFTPTPLFLAEVDKLPIKTIQPPLFWNVEILQGGVVISKVDERIGILKAPFTIRISMPAYFPVILNVLDDEEKFKLIKPGMNSDCPIPFCHLGGIAEGHPYEAPINLIIDDVGYHYLVVEKGPNLHRYRWSRIEITESGIVFERDVFELNSQPIEQYSGNDLYMSFWVDYCEQDFINEDELQKVVLFFGK